jgi:hypothetical protein
MQRDGARGLRGPPAWRRGYLLDGAVDLHENIGALPRPPEEPAESEPRERDQPSDHPRDPDEEAHGS